MGHDKLEEARAKRAEKEAAKAVKGKGRRGQKPKALEEVKEATVGEKRKRSEQLLTDQHVEFALHSI